MDAEFRIRRCTLHKMDVSDYSRETIEILREESSQILGRPLGNFHEDMEEVHHRGYSLLGMTVNLKGTGLAIVTRYLGRGGMGLVYQLKTQEKGQLLAIKTFLPKSRVPDISGEDYLDMKHRFVQEARMLANIHHPNLVNIMHLGILDDENRTLFYVMEYLPGSLPEGTMPISRVVSYGLQAASGLAACHNAKIIHRDMKPQNLLIDAAGTLKVTDFGIAKNTSELTRRYADTKTGVFFGTPEYSSPEQASGVKDVTPTTDVWSLGLVLFELLTSELPWDIRELEPLATIMFYSNLARDDVDQRLLDAAKPSSKRSDIPQRIDRLVYAMLQPKADLRPEMSEVAAEFESIRHASSESVVAGRLREIERHRRTLNRKRKLPSTLRRAVLLLLIAIIIIGYMWLREQKKRTITQLKEQGLKASPEEAVQIFTDLLDEYLPEDPEVWYRLGDALLRAGRPNDALDAFDNCARRAEQQGNRQIQTDARFQIAMANFAMQRLTSARANLEQIAPISKANNIPSLFLQALQKRNNWPEQIKLYNQLLVIDSANPYALFAKAYAHYSANEHVRAIELYTKSIAHFEDAHNLSWLAWCYNGRGIAWLKTDLVEAFKDLNEAIRLSPQFALAFTNRGVAYKSKGDLEKAIQDHNRAIELAQAENDNTTTAMALSNRGNIYSVMGESDKALKDYNRAISIDPDYSQAYYNRGRVFSDTREFQKAIDDYSKAITLNPVYTKAYHNRGYTLYAMGKYEEAIADYAKALEYAKEQNDLESAEMTYNNRGRTYFKKCKYKMAIDDYSSAIELNQNNAEAFTNRGVSFELIGNLDQAIADHNRAIELSEEIERGSDLHAICHVNRGNTWVKKSAFKKAITDYNKAVDLGANLAQAYNGIGHVQFLKQQYDEAITTLTKAIELSEKSKEYETRTQAYYNRGLAYEMRNIPDKSIRDYDKVIEFDRNRAEAYGGRGRIQVQLGDYDNAIADFNMAIKLYENYDNKKKLAETYNNRGSAQILKGDINNATADFRKSVKIDPELLKGWLNLAHTYLRNGSMEEANMALQNCVRLEPTNAVTWYNLACTYARCDKQDKAIEALKQSLELDTTTRLRDKAKTDPDFESLRDLAEFKHLTSQ